MALVITDAGRAASIRAGDLGIELKITHISIGTEGYTPDQSQTELRAEIIRKPVVRGRIIKLGHLHFEADFDGKEEFEGKEIGYHLDDDAQTLFGVDSNNGAILSLKKANSVITEAIDLNLSASRIENITVEVATTPYANEETPGIAEVATTEEVTEGVDDERIITAKKLHAFLGSREAINVIYQESDTIQISKRNVLFRAFAFPLRALTDGAQFSARVDESVDLKSGEVKFTPPEGESVNYKGERHPFARIVSTGIEVHFARIKGEWHAWQV